MTIFKPLVYLLSGRFQKYSLENILKKGLNLLDSDYISELSTFIEGQVAPNGGFKNRAEDPDLYYSLFGYLICQSLQINNITGQLSGFLKNHPPIDNLNDVDLASAAILFNQLLPDSTESKNLSAKFTKRLKVKKGELSYYDRFLGIVTFFYLKRFLNFFKLVFKKQGDSEKDKVLPCSVLVSRLILLELKGKPTTQEKDQLMTYYKNEGGFAAFKEAPVPDLLSTAVALFALNFTQTDIRDLAPDCLDYISSLYTKGGFRATHLDAEPDVEYTFYGLLALGSLGLE